MKSPGQSCGPRQNGEVDGMCNRGGGEDELPSTMSAQRGKLGKSTEKKKKRNEIRL